MNRAISYVARRRWAAVGLALVVEIGALLALAHVGSDAVVGLPGAIVAAIAGTVAVVVSPLDGVLVALVGALVFGTAIGWEAGMAAAAVVWPLVVAAAGMFARSVERSRAALQEVLAAQEFERQRVAFELHEQIAQTLAGALMALKFAEGETEKPAVRELLGDAREQIQQTVREVRDLSIELRPHTLDTYGVVPAVETLALTTSERSGIPISVRDSELDRLTPELELALYRIVEDALATAVMTRPERVELRLRREGTRLLFDLDKTGKPLDPAAPGAAFAALRERVRLLGGRLAVDGDSGRAVRVHADIPV